MRRSALYIVIARYSYSSVDQYRYEEQEKALEKMNQLAIQACVESVTITIPHSPEAPRSSLPHGQETE